MFPSIRTRCSSLVCVHRSSSSTPSSYSSSPSSALRLSLSFSKLPPTRPVMPNRRFHSAEATVSSAAAVPAAAPSAMTSTAGTNNTALTAAEATRALSKKTKTKKPFAPALQQQQQQVTSSSSSSSSQQPNPHWNSGPAKPKVRPFPSEHPHHSSSPRPPHPSGFNGKREPRIQPIMAHKQSRPGHSRLPPAVRAPSPPVHGEQLSPSVQILCEAMAEGNIRRVKNLPPIFLASTYQEAEMMMQLFTEYYQATKGKDGSGPVGLDTETTTTFITKVQQPVSLIQIATQDVCLLFQIYNIMGGKQKKKIPFPPRLKAFLEDPKQLMCGVGIMGDAQMLRKDYGVDCQGVVELSQMATERRVLGTSLADLDLMFGRPGREVIKTRKILGWNWDREVLDPKWIWYAAKDAFAGVAIYENMMAGQLKPGYQTFAQRFPMTEEEIADDILESLVKVCGKGKLVTVNTMLNSISKYYGRFQKVYQPEQRYFEAQRYLQRLVRDGKVIPVREHEVTGGAEDYILHKNDTLKLPGVDVSTILRTPQGFAMIKSFFHDRELELSTLSPKCVTSTAAQHPEEQNDEDLKDLRMFLDFASQWDLPRRSAGMTNVYFQAVTNVENDRIYKEELLRQGFDPAQYPLTRSERLQAVASMEQSQNLEAEEGEDLKGEQDDDQNDDTDKEAAALMSSSSLADDPAQSQQETTRTAATTTTVACPIDRSTLPKAQLDKSKVKQVWLQFLTRLEKRGLIKQENAFYVLTPDIKTRLLSLATENVNGGQDQEQHPWTIVVPGDGMATKETALTGGDSVSSSNPYQDDGPEKRLRLDTSVVEEEDKVSEAIPSL